MNSSEVVIPNRGFIPEGIAINKRFLAAAVAEEVLEVEEEAEEEEEEEEEEFHQRC